jgi:hypothetical protein
MKKFIFCLMAIFLSLTFIPVQSFAATTEDPTSLVVTKAPEPVESAEAKALITRLDEIKEMDKSKLNSTEKKDLRKEVKSIKRELKDISGGVYISAGALIVILIILIVIM